MNSLRPVGVFWDIENCCVPKGKSALKIIERIRERFFDDCREAEFICVCDINKEAECTIKDLNDGQINVVHINATAKNAADDKIRQSLRRFSDSHQVGTKVVLISSDVNFASDLSDLRHRKKFYVVLVHKSQVSEALLSCANENYLYEDLIKDLPDRPGQKELTDNLLVVYGYSKDIPLDKVRHLLKMISNNCGGKVSSIGPLFAILKFETLELMDRAKKRMNGEDVYGRKITVCLPEETPFHNTIRKMSFNNVNKRNDSPSPQRRSSRQRTTSRTYTPEMDDMGSGGGSIAKGINPHYDPSHNSHYYIDQYYQKNSLSNQDNNKTGFGLQGNSTTNNFFQPVSGPLGSINLTQPPPPISTNQPMAMASSTDGSGKVENSLYTLPNSSSERFYMKSGVENGEETNAAGVNPSSSFNSATTSTTAGGKTYEISDLRQAGKTGTSIVVFKPKVQSLKDIPTPSFGFRDMPPPSLPNMPSVNLNQGKSLDPIKLIEAASKDKSLYGQQTGSIMPKPSDFMEQPKKADSSGNSNQNINNLSKMMSETGIRPTAPSKNSSIPEPQKPTQQQARSLSTGLIQTSNSSFGQPTTDTTKISTNQGYPSSNSYNDKQNSQPFKRPATPKKVKHQSPSRGFNNVNSTKQSGATGGGGANASFKPRASSVSPIFGIPSMKTNQQRPVSPFGNMPMPRPRPKQPGCHLYRVPTPDSIDPEMDFLCPDFSLGRDHYVELMVSNLDYNIHAREWRKILYATFQPHVKVLSIEIRLQADNTCVANIRLPTEQDARFAISQFHRRKIGYKRISVQFKNHNSQSPADSLRMDTISLLMEAKDHKLALSRIIDLFDQRFHKAVSVSDIYKMRDIIQIQEISGAGRWVKLQPGVKRQTTPVPANEMEQTAETFEQPVCPIHCHEGTPYHMEALNACMLPNVVVMRKHFSPQLHSLLLSHNGYVPLMSFPACYAAEFYPLKPTKEGIPLEHVIACVPGVEISVSRAGVKVIQFQENKEPFYDMMKGTTWQELGKISRDMMDLLRHQQNCSMPVSKFIPSFHAHFGRQCRVADYGYSKLQDLFGAIPHAIQVLGTGERKVITLSPRAQIKRFTTDIIKVVKAQPAKQIMLHEFAHCFEKVMGHPLYLPHYGVSYIEDVLSDIPTTTLIVIEEGKHTLLAVPRRDQTPEEVERTKQFAMEVVDLLKHHPYSRMAFNKFIPAYHHHFGRQCRVNAFGFNKLMDLFESISHVIEIEEEGEERILCLTPHELRKVWCEQLVKVIAPVGHIPINNLMTEFSRHHGFGLRLGDMGIDNVHSLVEKMKTHLKIEIKQGQEYVTLVQEVYIPVLGLQVMQVLMDESGGSLPLMELCMRYESLFGKPCDVKQIREELQDFVQIYDTDGGDSGGNIRLTTHQLLGRNLRLLLLHRHQVSMCDLTTLYRQQFGVELSPALYGFQTLFQLLYSFPHILQLKGKHMQKYLIPSGMMATPGILPPARVDVFSPMSYGSSFSFNSSTQSDKFPTTTSNLVQQSKSLIPQLPPYLPPPSSSPSTSSPISAPAAPAPAPLSSSSQLLQHASQLWDPAIVHHSNMVTVPSSSSSSNAPSISTSTRILERLNLSSASSAAVTSNGATTSTTTSNPALSLPSTQSSDNGGSGKKSNFPLPPSSNGSGDAPCKEIGNGAVSEASSNDLSSSNSGAVELAPSGVPAAWQIKLVKNDENSSELITSGNLLGAQNITPLPTTSTDNKGNDKDPHFGSASEAISNASSGKASKSGDDSFISGEPPLDTSSTHSQLNSSSQSSMGSPVKRKPRIAANFSQAH